MTQKAYSFLDVNAAIVGPGGSFSIGAGAGNSDEGIVISPTEDANTMTIGADGLGMHSLHADKSGSVILRLLKTSPTNALLQAMFNFQRTSGANHGQNTITISNSSSGDIITCEQVAFSRQPDINYAKNGNILEWHFQSIRITDALGQGV